jgi:hypothetical protein
LVGEKLVGDTASPPNTSLPWASNITSHVPVHHKIMIAKMARNGTPQITNYSKSTLWKIGDYFKYDDMEKTTLFVKAYRPYPSVNDVSAEAEKLEKDPQTQPFEQANNQGIPNGIPIDISQGKVILNEPYLVTSVKVDIRFGGYSLT